MRGHSTHGPQQCSSALAIVLLTLGAADSSDSTHLGVHTPACATGDATCCSSHDVCGAAHYCTRQNECDACVEDDVNLCLLWGDSVDGDCAACSPNKLLPFQATAATASGRQSNDMQALARILMGLPRCWLWQIVGIALFISASVVLSKLAVQHRRTPDTSAAISTFGRQMISRYLCRGATAATSSGSTPPPGFLCPISCELMEDPVCDAAGFSYERKAIEAWLHTHNTDPTTNGELSSKRLVPNRTLRSMILEWKEQHEDYSRELARSQSARPPAAVADDGVGGAVGGDCAADADVLHVEVDKRDSVTHQTQR